MIHLLSLNPALDFFFKLKSGPGKVGLLQDASVEAGGKALNLARFLRGMRTPAVTWLGTGGGSDPTHLLFRALLEKERLKVRYLGGSAPIRFTAVFSQGGLSQKFNHPGFEVDLTRFGNFLKGLKPGDLVILTGRLPAGMSDSLYASWVKALGKRGVRVALDSSGSPLGKALAQRPWFVKVNLFEMSEALNMKIPNLKGFIRILPRLLRSGLLQGAVTNGAEGAVVWNGSKACRVWSPAKVKGQVVGAGDGFLAGYLKGTQGRMSFKQTARLACAAGLTVAQGGIRAFDPKQVERNLKHIKWTEL
ncbi:MAG TPA: PfkB family carbohydrate kinase [bacterium]|nr:PfkB family carbohydrate kinase [bacterium]